MTNEEARQLESACRNRKVACHLETGDIRLVSRMDLDSMTIDLEGSGGCGQPGNLWRLKLSQFCVVEPLPDAVGLIVDRCIA